MPCRPECGYCSRVASTARTSHRRFAGSGPGGSTSPLESRPPRVRGARTRGSSGVSSSRPGPPARRRQTTIGSRTPTRRRMTGWPTAPDSYHDPMTAPARGQPVHLDPPGPEPVGLGRFGEFGGRFVPETLVPALIELEDEFRTAWASDVYRAEFAELLRSDAGRPTPVTECHCLS